MTSDGASVYVLKCADGSYYTGSTRRIVDERFAEHRAGLGGDYTLRRLPVELIHAEHFQRITDAIAFERQFKGWSRGKKEAFLRGDFDGLKLLARVAKDDGFAAAYRPRPSRRAFQALLRMRAPVGFVAMSGRCTLPPRLRVA